MSENMNAFDQWLVALTVLSVLFLSLFAFATAWRQHRIVQRDALRFRLFAARDRLYVAAASGAVLENTAAFVGLRSAINHLIRETGTTGAIEFISFMTPNHDRNPAFLDGLSDDGRLAVREVIASVAQTLMDLFQMNSRVARILQALRRRP